MSTEPRRPSAFDIRLVIALLIGLYGLVITVMGLAFTSDAQIDRAAGVNINLWAGIGMLIGAAAFVVWARLRPLVMRKGGDAENSAPPPE